MCAFVYVQYSKRMKCNVNLTSVQNENVDSFPALAKLAFDLHQTLKHHHAGNTLVSAKDESFLKSY